MNVSELAQFDTKLIAGALSWMDVQASTGLGGGPALRHLCPL